MITSVILVYRSAALYFTLFHISIFKKVCVGVFTRLHFSVDHMWLAGGSLVLDHGSTQQGLVLQDLDRGGRHPVCLGAVLTDEEQREQCIKSLPGTGGCRLLQAKAKAKASHEGVSIGLLLSGIIINEYIGQRHYD